jgi:tetratricopeptide (TPR) repeat protein
MGTILLEMGKLDDAKKQFDRGASLVAQSGLPPGVKKTVEKFSHYYAAQVALLKKDFTTANAESAKFSQEAEASKAQNQIRFAHEVKGMIALAQKHYDLAITELDQANQQDAYNLYRIGLAYQAKGDKERSTQYFTKAAKFYGLPSLSCAFIRTKAAKML